MGWQSDSSGSKLIQLEDGTFVEIEVPEYRAQEVSAKFADRVRSNLDTVEIALFRTAQPIIRAVREMKEREGVSASAEIELGLSFGPEGEVYITKIKSEANLYVKISLKTDTDIDHYR